MGKAHGPGQQRTVILSVVSMHREQLHLGHFGF